MVVETGKHPGALKDMVTSPAGKFLVLPYVLPYNGMRTRTFAAD